MAMGWLCLGPETPDEPTDKRVWEFSVSVKMSACYLEMFLGREERLIMGTTVTPPSPPFTHAFLS